MADVVIKLVSEVSEVVGIRDLQSVNLKRNVLHRCEVENLDATQVLSHGFVSAEYSVEYLQTMNDVTPCVIAVDAAGLVIAYALVTTKEVASAHPLLTDMVRSIDGANYQGRSLGTSSYVIIGQLCIAEAYRGQGLVPRLYDYFRQQYQQQFKFMLTDVSTANPRSLKAHLKYGFEIVDQQDYDGDTWYIVLKDWTKQ